MPTSMPGLDTIFCAAVELADPADRAAYLARACGPDEALRRRVEALIAAHFRAGGFLEQPAEHPDAATAHSARPEQPGTAIGPYKLLEQIGEGGMGTVWMARQDEPVRRTVAVKLIKPGFGSKAVLSRFEAERQALALMEHPNIARVLDAGATAEGRPYFVMELVKGVPLTKFCDDRRLTVRQRLELLMPVCHAIQHAHQKGIIHRDLKPSNVLAALYDDRPVPKVIDFGVAKATGPHLIEETLHTGFGAVIGTVEYMSPEQAAFNQLDIDTRSDIYSLGVLLYELLTGTTPVEHKRVQESGLLEALRIIREEEPPTVSQRLGTTEELPAIAANRGVEPARLGKLVRGELDWIVVKSLEKDRDRRYQTANDLAMDVQRYLNDEPVLACPPSAWYRCNKFARRNKTGLVVAALALFVLATLLGGVGWLAQERAAQLWARQGEADFAVRQAAQSLEQGRPSEAGAWVRRADVVLRGVEASASLEAELSAARADLAMLTELEEIRIRQSEVQDESFARRRSDLEYGKAFRDYGIDLDALDPAEAADRIRSRSIRVALAAALDDWADIRRHNTKTQSARWQPLLAIARAADPDPVRCQIRDAWERSDFDALERLAAAPQAVDLPPSTILMMDLALERPGRIDEAIAMLRLAQQRHPNDFWINHQLGFLIGSKPNQAGEAVRFLQVALALRPHSPGVRVNFGNALKGRGKRAEAEAEYREALRLKPDYAGAHYNLGDLWWEQGSLAEAEAEYREALRLKPGFAEAHKGLGNSLLLQGKLVEAEAAYREALRLKPDYADAHGGLGNSLVRQGKLAEAEAEYREALRLKPDCADAHGGLGNSLVRQGKLAEAEAEYREALRLEPDFAEAHYNFGNLRQQQGKWAEAEAAYREALRLKPDFAEAHVNLGNALQEKGRFDEAIAAYREALRLKPDLAEAHDGLGNGLSAKRRFDEAIPAYREAIRLKPDTAGPHYNLGNLWLKQGKPVEAEAAYRKALRLKPDFAQARVNLGVALADQGKAAEAEAAYREAIRYKPDLPEAHSQLGNALAAKSLFDEAIAAYREAIRLKPDDASPHYNLGNLWLKQGKPVEAEAAFHEALRLKPDLAQAHSQLGKSLLDQGKPGEAQAAYRESIRLKPDDAIDHNNLGVSFDGQGKPAEAEAAYREAIRLKPDYADAHHNLGNALNRQGQVAEAEVAFRKALRLKSDNVEAYVSLGALLCDHKHDYRGAIAAFQEAIRLKPGHVTAWTNRGIAHVKLKEYAKAIADFSKAIELKPDLGDATFHENLAWLFATCADPKCRDGRRAVEHAQKAVKLRPNHANAWNNLGAAYHRAGDWKNAVEALEKADQMLNGGDRWHRFFLVMAHWQLGNREQALKYYQQAVEWMEQDQNRLQNDELRRFRAEAEEVMEIKRQ